MGRSSRQFAPGDVLFSRGDPATTLYTIESGEVDLFVPPGRTFLVRLGAGACLGEQALIAGGVRNATAVAVSEVVCQEMTAQALQDGVGPHCRCDTPGSRSLPPLTTLEQPALCSAARPARQQGLPQCLMGGLPCSLESRSSVTDM
ncbi:MAG: cyclic nucleotide-binding domain-containing protein [Limnohabitans sp.]